MWDARSRRARTGAIDWGLVAGRVGLLATVDARVGEERVEGAEIIGWDPARDAYVTRYFGSDGPNAYEATLVEEDDARLDHAQLGRSLRGPVQRRREHHHWPLGAARRRQELAAMDGRHVDEDGVGRVSRRTVAGWVNSEMRATPPSAETEDRHAERLAMPPTRSRSCG
jgi:hypothetical protein